MINGDTEWSETSADKLDGDTESGTSADKLDGDIESGTSADKRDGDIKSGTNADEQTKSNIYSEISVRKKSPCRGDWD